jgi:2'-5' RNA ligase
MADTFSVVSYLPDRLAGFVDSLRRRFDPSLAAWLSHVTILPPRELQEPLEEPLELLRKQCARIEPFEVAIRGVSTFWPVSGVVYLSFAAGADRLIQLHDMLNSGCLESEEVHRYVPHVTIAQELDEHRTRNLLQDVEREWSHYEAGASFRVESLFLVRRTPENLWIDLAPIRLGGLLAGTYK